MHEFKAAIRELTGRQATYAEMLALCVRYINNKAWCESLAPAEYDEFMRIVGNIFAIGMRG